MATPGYRFRYAHTLFRTTCRPRPPKGESDRPETRSAGAQRGTPRPVLPGTAAQLTAKVPNQNAFSPPGRVFDVFRSMNQPLACTHTPTIAPPSRLFASPTSGTRMMTRSEARRIPVYTSFAGPSVCTRVARSRFRSFSFLEILVDDPANVVLGTRIRRLSTSRPPLGTAPGSGTSGMEPRQTNSSPIGGREEARGPYNFE